MLGGSYIVTSAIEPHSLFALAEHAVLLRRKRHVLQVILMFPFPCTWTSRSSHQSISMILSRGMDEGRL